MKNILITGANGLLGSEFKARLTDEEAWFCRTGGFGHYRF